MKKSLVALAVLSAFVGVASAQSSVTIYGIVDVGFSRIDPKKGNPNPTTNANAEAPTTTGIEAGNRNGNRLGFRGTEDLGGGLNAIFQLENGFSTDTGTLGQGGRLFGRQAYAGLSGGFGRFVLGRVATFSSGTGSFDMYSDIDPFYTGYHTAGMQNSHSSAGSLRVDNAALWRSPNWGGVSVGVGYSFRGNGAENAGGGTANNSVIFSGVSFSGGPVYVALTYDRLKQGELTADPVAKHIQLGGTFDLKVVKLHASIAKEDNFRGELPGGSTPQQAAGSDASAFMFGVSVPLGSGKLMASYQKRNVDAITVGTVATPDGDRKVFGVGYEHNLSRRTLLHAVYGARTDSGSLKTTGNALTGTAAVFGSGGQNQLTLGMTHFF